MCLVYVYSCISACTCVPLSPLHTLPHWQLGKTWHWGKTGCGMEDRDRVGVKEGLKGKGGCLGAVPSHTAGEGAMKATMRWASPGDYPCFHVSLSFTCSPNFDWLAGLQTYCPARHATTITSPTSCISSFRYAPTQSSLAGKGFVKYEADCVYSCLLLSFVLFKVFFKSRDTVQDDRPYLLLFFLSWLSNRGSNQFVLFRTMLANRENCLPAWTSNLNNWWLKEYRCMQAGWTHIFIVTYFVSVFPTGFQI